MNLHLHVHSNNKNRNLYVRYSEVVHALKNQTRTHLKTPGPRGSYCHTWHNVLVLGVIFAKNQTL